MFPYPRFNIHRPPHLTLPNTVYFISARTYFAFPYFRHKEALEIVQENLSLIVKRFRLQIHGYVLLPNHYHLLMRTPVDLDYKIGKFIGQFHGRSSHFIRQWELNSLKPVSPDDDDRLKPVTPNEENRIYPVSGYDLTMEEFSHWKNQYLNKMGHKYITAEKRRLDKFNDIINRQDFRDLNKFIREQPKIFYQYLDKTVATKESFYKHLNYLHQNPVKHGYVRQMEDWEYSSYRDYYKKYGEAWLNDSFTTYPIKDFTCFLE